MPDEDTGLSNRECHTKVQVFRVGNTLRRRYRSLEQNHLLSEKLESKSRKLSPSGNFMYCGVDDTLPAVPPVRSMPHEGKVLLRGMLDKGNKGSQASPSSKSKGLRHRSNSMSLTTQCLVCFSNNGGCGQLTHHTHVTTTNGMEPTSHEKVVRPSPIP